MSFKTKQDQVADILRERVIAGVYARGTKLKQSEIAEELGVSITPVREALHILEAEGYIAGLSHRGLLVPEFVPTATREIFDLRLMLERELTAHAIPNVTAANLAELKSFQHVVSEISRGRDPLATRTANFRFHFRLYELADRPQTLSFVRVLWAKYPFIYQELGNRRTRHIEEHEGFLELVERGDRDGAVDAMVDHIRSGWEELHRHGWLEGGPAADGDRPVEAVGGG
ncbi:DNA-binding GntR family transcriptional regulator [Stella humosa]|uniref:DNA-binding GntR family transcriptional regulator n=1 Tax=Stella humosa TaxID=94 RepID=A0A3N1M7X6_9PROT|nr:GntR family transcriptional regulator [Stella humosa]ROP99797.1 DNA-binding GntR family transcriptional regulator [Stella humosa]